MNQQNSGRKKQIITTLAVLIVIVVIVAAVSVSAKKNKSSSDSTAATTTSSSSDTAATDTSSSSNTTSTASYKDGTYKATGDYNTPGGSDSIDLSLTIANGVITSTTASTNASDSESQEFDDNFLSAYKQLVVGKSVGSVNLSRVSGSSLTTQGFNDALEQIESDAKA